MSAHTVTQIVMPGGAVALVAIVCLSAWYYKQPLRLLIIPFGAACYVVAEYLPRHALDYSWVLVAIAVPLMAWSALKESSLTKRYVIWSACGAVIVLLIISRVLR
jgi:hypothetical protein